jgi:hypothetical protein
MWYLWELHCWCAHVALANFRLVECMIKLLFKHEMCAVRTLVMLTHMRLLLVAI